MAALKEELESSGVKFFLGEANYDIDIDKNKIMLEGKIVHYDFLFNCTGLFADKTAHRWGIGKDYEIMPFKGLYWKIKTTSKISISRNLYPVPDLNMPFLGVHFRQITIIQ